MSQQEDDLRGLAKTMNFMWAVSILFVVIHAYWYCYAAVRDTNFVKIELLFDSSEK